MTQFSPEAFGRYYLVDKIATGGMAEVFKAKSFAHGGFEKLLVIKRILQHLSGNDEFVTMFIDEAKISVELQHPNIVQIFDFGRITENYYIAMECVEGKDVKSILRKLAERRKLLPPEYAVYVAHEMSKGLGYAHSRTNIRGEALNIVHRDISPSNILVSYNGEVKIADFGIAKAESSAYNTKDGVLKGKFEYMSPEQASGKDIGLSTDIFSTGIILHEMLTGRRLFKTDSEIKTLEKIKAVDIPRPSELNPAISTRLDDLVMRALAKDVSHRFVDAKEFQAALLEYMYPATPDVTRESLSHFLKELFSGEISTERQRLEEGTRVATELWENAPEIDLEEEWEEGSPSASTIRTQPSKAPVVIIGVMAAMLAALVGAFILYAMTLPEPQVVERLVEMPGATTGSIQLSLNPEVEAKFYLGDTLIGEGSALTYDQVPPDEDLVLRVESDTHKTASEQVRIQAGERLRLKIDLERDRSKDKKEDKAPEEKTEAAQQEAVAAYGTAMFTTSPKGAKIILNGSQIGKTPMKWNSGISGQVYRVSYKLDGYRESSFKVSFPEAGEKESFHRSLKKQDATPGKVSVNVKEGWAEVYIDGKKVDTTPLYNHTLSAGKHAIKVVNPQTGFQAAKTVTIQAGETTRVNF